MEKIIVHDGISNEVFDFKTFEEAKEMILEEYVQEGSIHPDIECVKIFKQMFETKVTETKPNFYKVEFEELEAQTIGQAEVRVSQPSEPTFGQWITTNEKLPELSTWDEIIPVLILHKGFFKFGWRTKMGWRLEGSPSLWEDAEIEKWMPLPKP